MQFDSVESIRVEEVGEGASTDLHDYGNGEITETITGPFTDFGYTEPGDVFQAYYTHNGNEFLAGSHTVGISGSVDGETDTGSGDGDDSGQDSVPTHLGGVIGGTGENLEQGQTVERTYDYSINGGQWTYTSYVPQNLVEYYESRTRIAEYGAYAATPFDDQYIQDMADTFQDSADSDRQAIEFARAFVQDLDYTSDQVSQGIGNYPQFPVETMFASEGDCEDTSILLSSIYWAMGYGTVLLGLFDAEHMAVGLLGEGSLDGTYYEHDGGRYYYVETTAPGWQIGQMPDEITETNAEIIDVTQYPALTFSWSTEARSGGVDVTMMVSNQGDAMAWDVDLQAEFENTSGFPIASDSANVGTLSANQVDSESLSLDVPADEEVRGRFSTITGGTLYDEATTDWISPM